VEGDEVRQQVNDQDSGGYNYDSSGEVVATAVAVAIAVVAVVAVGGGGFRVAVNLTPFVFEDLPIYYRNVVCQIKVGGGGRGGGLGLFGMALS
tara:strand:+ start:352 stop:630 length:279 start_codon:yes stop_codon:yes gene_type:complete